MEMGKNIHRPFNFNEQDLEIIEAQKLFDIPEKKLISSFIQILFMRLLNLKMD